MLSYEIVDVFTDRAYAGNPLAVVFGAEVLSGEQMQRIAGEFNLSETAFVLPPTRGGATYRVRIFTPNAELPYAGHPSVGTAVTLARRGAIPSGASVQECGAGLLPITVEADTATLTGGAPSLGEPLDPAPLLAAAGLTESALAGRPRRAGTGLEFPYLPVSDEAVAAAACLTRDDVDEVYLFSFDPVTRTAHSRLFAPGFGIAEDPATGSAALGLGVYLIAEGLLPSEGAHGYTVLQGAERGRPSRLDCEVTAEAGAAVRVTVTGRVVAVATGELVTLPSGD